jgi:glycine cleavage system transcriptional repressor
MKKFRILSASGDDRPGIVHQVSRFVFDNQGNMEDSRMAILGGQFSLMMLFSATEGDIAKMERELPALQQQTGLRIFLYDAIDPREYKREPSLPVRLEVVAMDSPGIMVQIAEVLEKHRVNVETLDAHLSPAPASGTTVSSVKMKICVPQDVSLKDVKESLNALAGQINLDVVFQPVQE